MNKPLFVLGIAMVVLAVTMLWGVAAQAQQPEDAPLVLVNMGTSTPLTQGIVSGMVEVVMTREQFEESLPGAIVGYIFDVSVPYQELTPAYVLEPAYVFYGSQYSPAPDKICFLELYYADIPDWGAEVPAYVFGTEELVYCDGPIPTFADWY